MATHSSSLNDRYATAAPRWSDKMRVLGYYDGYLGFLSHQPREAMDTRRVIDVGAGTGAMAEAFVAVNGPPGEMAVLDPAPGMIAYAQDALAARGVTAKLRIETLDADTQGSYDVILAAHVIEHFDDPAAALAYLRKLCAPGARLWLVVSKPHWCSVLIWLKWRHRTFQRDEIRTMLEAAGFAVEAPYDFPAGPPSRTSFGVVARAV
ncbi:MAG: class I SAM-dependent methyltransferase [Sulfitobacter sp.]